ncbi:MAG: phosphoenolpyruvate carboxykinase, partial [Prevotella copri]|nr:phosphoenolpyruvate carboxykinase [Segatella copri]
SDMGRTTYFSCGGESWFSLDFIGCKALMRVSEDYRKAVFSVDTSAPTAGIVISSLSRALFAQIVLLHDGISVHSSCVVRDGKAFMFLGRSGTGKSTHSRLWIEAFPGTELLNDDNPAVRILPDGPRVFGTPWSGKTDCWRNLFAPLCGIVRLRQAPFDSFEPLDGIQAFSEVYPGCSVLRSDAFLHERLCDNLEMLCSLVKVGRMACLPDLEAARICAEGIASR